MGLEPDSGLALLSQQGEQIGQRRFRARLDCGRAGQMLDQGGVEGSLCFERRPDETPDERTEPSLDGAIGWRWRDWGRIPQAMKGAQLRGVSWRRGSGKRRRPGERTIERSERVVVPLVGL